MAKHAGKIERWKITDKMFRSLAITGAIIEFSQVGASFIDGLIISNFLGSDAMAAMGIVNPVYSILGVISGLIAVGMQLRCTNEIGRGNVKNMNRFFSASVAVGMVVSLLMLVLMAVFAKPFVILLGAKGNAASLADGAADYALGMALAGPALIMTAILAPAIQLDSGRKTIQTGAIIGSVADVLLDLLAVKLNTGLLGIAIATAISGYLNLLYQCTHFLKKNRMLHFVKPEIRPGEFMKMLANGGEKAVKRSVNIIRPIILNASIITYGGTVALSALSVHNNFTGFAEIILSGIAEAVALLTALYYGEVNGEGISEVNSCAYRAIFRSSGLICIALLVLARPLARLYVSEPGKLQDMVTYSMRMLALENPMIALISSRIKYLQAVHKKWNMNLLIFAARLIFVLISSFTLGTLFGEYGILSCFAFSDFLSLVAILIFYQIKGRKSIPTQSDFLALPPEFEPAPGDVISLIVKNQEDVSLTAEQIGLFCKGHGFSPKIRYYAALAFEELCSDIVNRGFPLNKTSDPVVDVRVVARGDRLILRMRDNCPQFDITREIARVNADDADPTRDIGIRVAGKIATNIRYDSAFETNNLIIEYRDPEKARP